MRFYTPKQNYRGMNTVDRMETLFFSVMWLFGFRRVTYFVPDNVIVEGGVSVIHWWHFAPNLEKRHFMEKEFRKLCRQRFVI